MARKMREPYSQSGHFGEEKYLLHPGECSTAYILVARPLSSNMRPAMSFYVDLVLILL